MVGFLTEKKKKKTIVPDHAHDTFFFLPGE